MHYLQRLKVALDKTSCLFHKSNWLEQNGRLLKRRLLIEIGTFD